MLTMTSIVIVIIILLLVFSLYNAIPKKSHRKSRSKTAGGARGMDKHSSLSDYESQSLEESKESARGTPLEFLCKENRVFCEATENDPQAPGLHEVVQHTRSRGYVPEATQPNHVANMWKSDYSQCDSDDAVERNEHYSDKTPKRISMVNLSQDDQSNMHLTSRFA